MSAESRNHKYQHIFGLLDETRQNLVLDEFSAVDSKAIWDKLEAIMMQKKPSSHFHAYEQLFSSVLQDGEMLPSFGSRVKALYRNCKDPYPTGFTCHELDF